MTKEQIAQRMNATDVLSAQVMKGKKMSNGPKTNRTWKLMSQEDTDVLFIVDPYGKDKGYLMPGTNGRFQLISTDGMKFAIFDKRPNLSSCVSIVR